MRDLPAEWNLYRMAAGRWPAAGAKEAFAMISWTLFLQIGTGLLFLGLAVYMSLPPSK